MTKFMIVFLGKVRCDPALQTSYFFSPCLTAGNPPYQEEFGGSGENKTYGAPVYHQFMDAVYGVSDKVELIHPARFLFNAGSTPKAWNKKMLEDPHFKVLQYEEDSTKVFTNTDIKGGVAITYRDSGQSFEPIIVFTKYQMLNDILYKVKKHIGFSAMDKIVVTRTAYRLTEKLHQEHPEALSQLSKGHPYDMSTNIFDRLPQVFLNQSQTITKNTSGYWGVKTTNECTNIFLANM